MSLQGFDIALLDLEGMSYQQLNTLAGQVWVLCVCHMATLNFQPSAQSLGFI